MKRVMSIALITLTCALTASAQQSAKRYEIGERGPAGGFVFYDKGRYSDGWRYLETAPDDQSNGIVWGAEDTDIDGNAPTEAPQLDGPGAGAANTAAILAAVGDGNNAAALCDSLSVNGYDDWYLPSKAEVELMYRNLKAKGVGGFKAAFYWSSTEADAGHAWATFFYYRLEASKAKFYVNRVRAVRSF